MVTIVPREPGTVHLVGGGPGDPGLITSRGLDLLRSADIVVHDRLIGSELLREARTGAELVDVGKGPGLAPYSQAEINALLVEQARRGRTVVRLKGGDPFVFGRGSEEAAACREAGVPVYVVPGVTSAIAGLAAAGIPVTARGLARSFAVVTAHTAAPDGGLNPLQAAFVERDALQCGYCTPGQICSATAMLGEAAAGWPSAASASLNPETGPVVLDAAEIRERMSGNLCRCGAYVNILAAITDVARVAP